MTIVWCYLASVATQSCKRHLPHATRQIKSARQREEEEIYAGRGERERATHNLVAERAGQVLLLVRGHAGLHSVKEGLTQGYGQAHLQHGQLHQPARTRQKWGNRLIRCNTEGGHQAE